MKMKVHVEEVDRRWEERGFTKDPGEKQLK
jgi:hypothetical protein